MQIKTTLHKTKNSLITFNKHLSELLEHSVLICNLTMSKREGLAHNNIRFIWSLYGEPDERPSSVFIFTIVAPKSMTQCRCPRVLLRLAASPGLVYLWPLPHLSSIHHHWTILTTMYAPNSYLLSTCSLSKWCADERFMPVFICIKQVLTCLCIIIIKSIVFMFFIMALIIHSYFFKFLNKGHSTSVFLFNYSFICILLKYYTSFIHYSKCMDQTEKILIITSRLKAHTKHNILCYNFLFNTKTINKCM